MRTLCFSRLSKSYDGVPALRDVDLTLRGGTVHALMGENGAGKSTLIRAIAGVAPADSLIVTRDGEEVTLRTPRDAHAAGFRFIHQELNVVPQVSVAENVLLGRELPRRLGVAVDWPEVHRRAAAALEELGAGHIDTRQPAAELAPGDRMLMRIAAALVEGDDRPAELYVLDEPTAALTDAESEMLFRVIDRLRAAGAAILYVSHRLDEVMRIADEITVLRDGRRIATTPVAETARAAIIERMTGREVRDSYPLREAAIGEDVVLHLDHVATTDLEGLSVTLRAGEILGVAGLAEAGQSRLLRLLMGLGRVRAGEALLEGRPLPRSPSEAWRRGVAYIPRERRSEALCLDLPVRLNVVLPHLGRYGLRASSRRERLDAGALGEQVRLRSAGPEQPVRHLSGGNQQKVAFARALMGDPRLLLLDEPTRGVDVGAKYDIYTLVRAQAARGCAVILASSDLPELIGMCDRVLVLRDGRQSHLLPCEGMTPAELLAQFYDREPEVAG